MAHGQFMLRPSLAFALLAFIMVHLTETGRVPVDNPSTHLELTMIHEAMILEYSGRHLALIEWAGMMKLFIYSALGIAIFCPWGIAATDDPAGMLAGIFEDHRLVDHRQFQVGRRIIDRDPPCFGDEPL